VGPAGPAAGAETPGGCEAAGKAAVTPPNAFAITEGGTTTGAGGGRKGETTCNA
jgi:hypothetical protein